jgi:hypothetical protein
MLTTYKLDKIEFVPTSVLLGIREFERPIKEKLKFELIENGMKDPIMLMYNAPTRRVYVGEGNHRIVIAKKLGIEALPTRVVRTERKPQYDALKGKVVKGVEPDWSGYVKGSLYPSEIGLIAYSLKKLCE